MKLKTQLTIVLLFIAIFVQAQFHHIHPYGHTFADIHFIDYQNGYAVGRDVGIGSCGPSNAALYRTMDAGKTWLRSAMDDSYELTAIQMLDQSTGWAVGYFGKSYRTTDCGATWTEHNTGAAYDLRDVFFLNQNLGFCVSENGRIRKTTNGGISWSASISGTTNTLNGVYFIDENIGFAVGNSGTLLRTQNGGGSWEDYDIGVLAALYDIEFITNQKGFISASDRLFRTENAGDSWEEIPMDIGPMRDIEFPTPSVGYVIGELGQARKTTDGGASWQTMNFPYPDYIHGLYFLDANVGYASGDGGSIFYTNDGGATWQSQYSGLNFSFGIEGFLGIDYLNSDTGIICGENGGIGITLNGGISWSRKITGTEEPLYETQWLSQDKLIVAGGNGTVLLSSDGGENWAFSDTGYDLDYIDLWFSNDGMTGYIISLQDSLIKTIDGGMSWELQVIPNDGYFREIDFWNQNNGVLVTTDAAFRTIDGGANWTEQAVFNAQGNLRSLDVVNDTLSFIGAVNLLKSTNSGESWDSIDMQNNLWPTSMEFLNDTLGYLVTGPNVRFTDNGGKNWYSVSTACLANSYAHNKIEVVDEHHVYNTGKTPMSRLWSGTPTIRTVLENNVFCPGAKFNVGYFYEGAYTSGNTYIAQLSDATGSFASPTNIGQYISPFIAITPSCVISCELPAGISLGGNYRIRVVGQDPQVIGTDNGVPIFISDNMQPGISLTVAGEDCPGGDLFFEATFENGGPLPQFQWFVNGIATDHTGYTWSVNSLQNGDMVRVEMTSDLNCASPLLVSSQLLTVNISPANIHISSDTIVCLGESVALFADGGESYTWSPVDGLDNPNSATPLATPLQSTTYTVIVSLSGGCTVSESMTLEIQPLPNVNISPDTIVCLGESVALFADGGESYTWSPVDDLDNPNSATPLAIPLQSTTYSVVVSSQDGCTFAKNMTLEIQLPPTLIVSDDITINIGQSANLSASGADFYQWSPATALNDPMSDEPICTAVNTTSYQVVGSDTLGCFSLDSVTVTVLIPDAPEIINFTTSDTTIYVGESISFANNTLGEVAEWSWFFEGGNPVMSVDSTPSLIQYDEVGCYMVSLSASNLGGSDILEKSCYIEVTEEIINGVQEINKEVAVWPNPAQNWFQIRDDRPGKRTILIYDIMGRVVYQDTFVGKEKTISVDGWAKGMYHVELHESGEIRVGRLIVVDY